MEPTRSNDPPRPVPTAARPREPASRAPQRRQEQSLPQREAGPPDHSPYALLPGGQGPAVLRSPGGKPRSLPWRQGRQDAPKGGHLPSTVTDPAVNTPPRTARARTQTRNTSEQGPWGPMGNAHGHPRKPTETRGLAAPTARQPGAPAWEGSGWLGTGKTSAVTERTASSLFITRRGN